MQAGRRSKIVWFRVSLDEYQRMLDCCASTGARSISDLARVAVTRFTDINSKATDPGAGIGGLVTTLHEIRTKVDEVHQLLVDPASLPRVSKD